MKLILSICIPTMNRPKWILQTLRSILASKELGEIEICISNNFSESDYSEVELLIESASNLCNIKYIRHTSRLSLDENHHYVKQMGSAEYVYFLGDDDYLLKGGIEGLIEFVKNTPFDLAIFNGLVVDANNCYLGMHFILPPREYQTLGDAFSDLNDKGSFGAVLVHRDHLNDELFKQFYGTDHAYGCFWLSIFRKYEQGDRIKIFIPNFPCVALRSAEKNYNIIDVYYKKVPYWMGVFKRLAGPGLPQQLIHCYDELQYKKISSVNFFLSLAESGFDLKLIEKSNPSFYSKNIAKITVCKFISLFVKVVRSNTGYKFLKAIYRKNIRKDNTMKLDIATVEINYLLDINKSI
jgi:abequosyltransferase